ncbi:hypothetical protein FRC03_009440 [Tulasnella sp. 419]|nr:hypothetical protein FRC03_009440 [Tulasnella sp. 419]
MMLRTAIFRTILSRGTSTIFVSTNSSARRSTPKSASSYLPSKLQGYRWASGTTAASSANDPAEVESLNALEEGTRLLEEGDVEGAKAAYSQSIKIKKTPSALFNYGVTCYHSKDFSGAIDAWKESIEMQPDSPDAHTNLASAYIMQPLSRPDLALHHLKLASELSPKDAEIAFNLGAVQEAVGNLEEALEQYKLSEQYGVERASVHIRNVSAKILGKKLAEAEAAQKSNS